MFVRSPSMGHRIYSPLRGHKIQQHKGLNAEQLSWYL